MEGDILCPNLLQAKPGKIDAGIISNCVTDAGGFSFTGKCLLLTRYTKAIIIFTYAYPMVLLQLTHGKMDGWLVVWLDSWSIGWVVVGLLVR